MQVIICNIISRMQPVNNSMYCYAKVGHESDISVPYFTIFLLLFAVANLSSITVVLINVCSFVVANSWLRCTVVERRSLTGANFPGPTLDL